jgi:hypothetical protein
MARVRQLWPTQNQPEQAVDVPAPGLTAKDGQQDGENHGDKA